MMAPTNLDDDNPDFHAYSEVMEDMYAVAVPAPEAPVLAATVEASTEMSEAEMLENSKLLDVHTWSDHPEVNAFVKVIYEKHFKSRKAKIKKKHLNRHSPYTIQIRGNRTTFPPPRELYPLCSHPMA